MEFVVASLWIVPPRYRTGRKGGSTKGVKSTVMDTR